jgi:hypothetical protein
VSGTRLSGISHWWSRPRWRDAHDIMAAATRPTVQGCLEKLRNPDKVGFFFLM